MERGVPYETQAAVVLVADVVKAPDGTVCDAEACTAGAVVSVSLSAGSPPRFWCACCWVGEAIRLHLRGYALRC